MQNLGITGVSPAVPSAQAADGKKKSTLHKWPDIT